MSSHLMPAAVVLSPADSCTLDNLSNPGVVVACISFLIGETGGIDWERMSKLLTPFYSAVFLLTVWKGVRTCRTSP
jgi:hypothetical protein